MSRKRTIAQQLESCLGGKWKAVRDGFGWMWVSDKGHEVRKYAESVLTYDGYSDSEFNTVYIDGEGNRLGMNGVIYWSGPRIGERQSLPMMMGFGDVP